MDFNKINDTLTVSSQITPDEVTRLAEKGFKTLINNRPDMEVEAGLSSDVMEEAAKAAGLSYLYLPVMPGQFTPDLIADMAQALAELDGPVYAYCRSGTRSCTTWALTQIGILSADEIVEQAAGAGYDLSAMVDFLRG
ncbi:TIGR01244 family protein [Celeribacter baekdonensis]|jgi:uncharacterized protein (TIGR01244 family)|uniref:TIGR01244 family protein n=1 Tax=Celeribacter baekdonensis TaxID=875171 RepID=A0A1G7PIJ5_9RHOB|nr:TIGR01244 family sulfur transferase [Celeribacter baekdonensis]SDF86061.1 TIGR01244 family protein [Celeribacter baekdonensis]